MSSTEEGRGEASNRIESDPDSAEDASPQPQRSAIIEPVQSMGEFVRSNIRVSNMSTNKNGRLKIGNFLAPEVLPRMDNYRQSLKLSNKLRPSLDNLMFSSTEQFDEEKDIEIEPAKAGKIIKFGWMDGVLMKCLLNIWGVMLYLRLTWVIGQAGLVEGLFIIGIANLVTIVTAISMSAVCTNGTIKAGGVYYMISRSLGPEFGGAIGLMFFIANSIAVAMYLIGFCESLLDCLKQYGGLEGITEIRLNDVRIIGCSGLVAILILAIVGMDWVTRVQIGLLALLVVSQVDFVVGTFIPPRDELKAKGFIGYNGTLMKSNLWQSYTFNKESGKQHDFFSVFAVFFPAVTGIVAGANLSGDLKDPSEAIPKGTLLAIAITCVSYLSYGVLAAGCSLREASGIIEEVLFAEGRLNETISDEMNITQAYYDCSNRKCEYGLLNSQQMIEVMSAWGPLIYAGCFAATLSSAIGSLEGAPRVFQALSKDKLLPGIHYFAKGRGANNDPVRGYFLVSGIALVCLLIGNLNIVSSLLSNFFVAAYALINLCVFHVSMTKSPSWRPKFQHYNKWVSLFGTILCIVVMFLMDWRTALATFIIILLLCVAIRKNNPDANWGSSTQSQIFISALRSVHSLTRVEDHVKNYRPKIAVLSGDPADRPCLVDFANLITKRHSLLECIHIVKDTMDWKSIETVQANGVHWLRANHIKAFYKVSRHSDFYTGARTSLEMSGLGKLKPNMMMVGFKEDWRQTPGEAKDYFKVLQVAFEMRLSVGVLRLSGGLDISGQGPADIFTIERIKRFTSQTSVDSGVDDKDSSNSPPSSSYSPQPEYKQSKRLRLPTNILTRVRGTPKAQDPAVLTTSKGNEIHDAAVVKSMTQFKGIDKVDGFIDVYWLYDDGGLTLLLPYILTTRKKFENAHLRIFILGTDKDISQDLNSMEEMMFRLRINCHQITVLNEADHYPGKATRDEFSTMIAPFTNTDNGDDSDLLSDTDLKNNNDRTVFHLRLAEIVRDRSKDSLLVIMTLPLPKMDDSIPYPLYLAWLDMLTVRMPPFLLVRGNQDSVLSMYL